MQNFLSLVDRYLSNFHSVWYRRCAKVRWVVGIQLGAFILLFLLMKPHYIFGLIQVECNVAHPLDTIINFGFIFLFIILCLSGQLTVYIMIRKYLVVPIINQEKTTNGGITTTATTNTPGRAPPTRNIQQHGHKIKKDSSTDKNPAVIVPEDQLKKASSTDKNLVVIVPEESDVREPNKCDPIEEHHYFPGPIEVHLTESPNISEEKITPVEAVRALQVESSHSSSFTKNNQHFVRIRDQIVSRIELEATRNVIVSVGMLLLFTLPWIISSVLGMICQRNVIQQAMDENKTAEALVEQCNRYRWASTYTRLLLIAHCIYQSFSFLTRSKDISAALRRT